MIVSLIAAAGIAASLVSPQYTSLNVCSELDADPTVDGVMNVGVALLNQGFPAEQAAELLVGSVQRNCPEYIPLLFEFADTYGG